MQGLSQNEAQGKLKEFGYNELPSAKPKSVFRIIFDVIKEPMLILLVSCGTLYMLIGDFGEGLMLLASILIVIAISFFQEKKTERALDELRDLSSPRALVIRDGKETRIAGREVVVKDIVVLQEGDRVPADAFVLTSTNLQTDESLLTGESVAVSKTVWDGKKEFGLSSENAMSCVYSGTLIVRGHGIAEVAATGTGTEMGKIGKLLHGLDDEPSLLQQETKRIVKTFSILGLGVCVLLVIVYGLTRGDWVNGMLYGLSLAMAMLPEEFAVVLTLFMALGAWRLSKKNVLTRKPSSIETLGSVTVLCTDKTGTLTENKMTVRKLFANGKARDITREKFAPDKNFDDLLELGMLAGQSTPFDPMEKAIVLLGKQQLQENTNAKREFLKEYPLSPKLFAMSRVYDEPGKSGKLVAAKGAPEAIAELCKMSSEEKEQLTKEVAAFASQGLRVLGVARSTWKKNELPEHQRDFDFVFAGLIGMEDPLRETINSDLASCYTAGIRVIMITGDYPVTAQHIARKMGLRNADEVITGNELSEMDEYQLQERIKTVNIFARMIPEQKLRLVEALKNNGEVVAMTGDGVNDAPALRAAHIGIAMGQRGTDVARESADLVLLDDNFSSIIAAVRTGRRIYDNIRKAMAYIFAVHVPVAGLTLVPVFFPILPAILFPLHIAFLELIIDPASTLIFESEDEEKNIMSRKPANMHQPIFGAKKIFLAILQGLSVLAVSMIVLLISRQLERPADEVRALTFTTLVIANIGLIFINRSYTRSLIELFREKNAAVKWVVGGAASLLALILFIPAVRKIFHFDLLHADDLLICFAAGAIGLLGFEIIKMVRRMRRTKRMENAQ
jgi:Ca2+-transporting ATPase